MSGSEALDVLDYLDRFPEVEETIDIQLARILQSIASLCGSKLEFREARIRGTQRTEEQIAEEWIQWIDERKNRTTNKL